MLVEIDLSLVSTTLTALHLRGNDLTSMSNLSRLKALERLHCGENKFTSFTPEIQTLTLLTHVDVVANTLSSFPDLHNLTLLQDLRVIVKKKCI